MILHVQYLPHAHLFFREPGSMAGVHTSSILVTQIVELRVLVTQSKQLKTCLNIFV